jgi:hypothetical protein
LVLDQIVEIAATDILEGEEGRDISEEIKGKVLIAA